MNLLDRFSSHLKDILARSIHLATELKNIEVEPIHLFFAISNQKGSVATEIINRFKIAPQVLEQALLHLPSHKDDVTKRDHGNTLTPLSPTSKNVLEKAMTVAQENNHNYIGSEHLLAALVRTDDKIIQEILQVSSVNQTELNKQLDTVLANATHLPHLGDMTEVAERIEENLQDQGEHDHEHDHSHEPEATQAENMFEAKQPTNNRKKESALEFFATNLTNPEIQKNIDPVIGREHEIERVIQIICRRTKNNPLLLGEPGIGKTAIVEGLAKRILEGTVPEALQNKKIYALDMGMLIAGTIYRGEFEARLRQVIQEATSNPNIILFIDELHNIVGAGSNQGAMDAANILKPALSRGHLRCIGATTPQEYKKYIENDAALERRFQPVIAREPSAEDTLKILEGIRPNYEAFHRVKISDEALKAAVTLSTRYITNKFLPDKAIDLLDETAAAKRIKSKKITDLTKLVRLEQRLEKVIASKEAAAHTDKFTEAVELKKEEELLRAEIKKMQASLKNKKITFVGTVEADDMIEQVSKIIGTAPSELLLDDKSQLNKLEDRLKEYVVGQDQVVHEVSQLIRQAKLGLSSPDRPLASCMFVGESGVGKTELAKSLAKVLYANSDALIKLDMSEFNESFGVSKLLGSPAGYVGYKESNQFTDKIKMNPHCVVLFDEIDKAHRDIVKLLLQILENGEISDATGKKVSLRHAVIILTTSLGTEETKRGSLGFLTGDAAQTKETRAKLLERLREHFSPEIMNRLDKVCFFDNLTADKLVRIAELELHRFNERLTHYQTSLSADSKVLAWIVAGLPKKNMSAREVRRHVRSSVEELMSSIIFEHKLKKKYALTVTHNKLAIK